jgi:hypothetical protein
LGFDWADMLPLTGGDARILALGQKVNPQA